MRTGLLTALLLAFALAAPVYAYGAEDSYVPVTADMFEKQLPGNTIKGEYRFLRERTNTFNFSETHNADGTTLYSEGGIQEPGVWYTLKAPDGSPIGDRICYKYSGIDALTGTHCFWVYLDEGCYYGFGRSSMSVLGRPRSFNDWEARWVIKGDDGTCSAPVT